MENNKRGGTYFPYLDGLRCLSVFWVILIHLKLSGNRAYDFIAGHGWMGVDMFFVISGFLITGILLREHERERRISLKNFYSRRILRIWPAYYLLLAIIAALAALGLMPRSSMILETIKWPIAYLTNAYAGWHRTENCAVLISWSLSLEEQFYLLWPLLLFVSPKRAWKIAAGAIVAVTAWRTWLTFHLVPGVMTMRRIFYAPDTRIDVILYGCLLAFLLADPRNVERVRRLFARRWLPVALAIAFVAAIYMNNRWSGHLGNSIGYSVSAIVMTAVIAYIHTVRPTWLTALLERRPVVWCGRVSYGIYLFHGLVIEGARALFGGVPSSVGGKIAFAVFVYGGAIAAASLSYVFFESWFLRLKERFSAQRESRPLIASAAS